MGTGMGMGRGSQDPLLLLLGLGRSRGLWVVVLLLASPLLRGGGVLGLLPASSFSPKAARVGLVGAGGRSDCRRCLCSRSRVGLAASGGPPEDTTVADEQQLLLAEEHSRGGDGVDVSRQLALFRSIALPYFKEDGEAKLLLAGVMALTLLNSGVSVAFSYIGRDFWTALSAKETDEFYSVLQRFMAALVAGVPITVLYRFQREKLALKWREWMTQRVMGRYYSSRTYYVLEASKEIDNPDQRIAEDVRSFTKVSLEFFISIITSVIDLVSFSAILFQIYPELFLAILAYAGLGTAATTYIGRSLVGLNFEQLQREADFRFGLIRVRENSESIAFYGGEQLELNEVSRRLARLLDNFSQIISAQRNLEFFTVSYRYLIQILPAFIVAPLYFEGKIQLGVVNQAYGAFSHILSDLSLIVNQFESLSQFSAGIDRLGEFMERMDADAPEGEELLLQSQELAAGEVSALPSPAVAETIQLRHVPGAALSVENLSVVTPGGTRQLVTDVSFRLDRGERLLIVGESGTGKSSLLRALSGLWTRGSGHVVAPSSDDTFFLPQKPYCTTTRLRDQITYPQRVEGSRWDDELLLLLQKVGLGNLASLVGEGDESKGLRTARDWGEILSLGEQQRLAFARLMFNRPMLAYMDEATSALDLANERKMYSLLKEIPGLSYVSVGHRPSLLEYHDRQLKLISGAGLSTLSPINKVASASKQL